jgi:hypothetical protein
MSNDASRFVRMSEFRASACGLVIFLVFFFMVLWVVENLLRVCSSSLFF